MKLEYVLGAGNIEFFILKWIRFQYLIHAHEQTGEGNRNGAQTQL